MQKILVFAGFVAAALAGCTDSNRANMGSKFSDQPADITCWSYGTEIFSGRSTGRVNRRDGGLNFVDAANGRLTTIQGDCRVIYLPKTK